MFQKIYLVSAGRDTLEDLIAYIRKRPWLLSQFSQYGACLASREVPLICHHLISGKDSYIDVIRVKCVVFANYVKEPVRITDMRGRLKFGKLKAVIVV